MDGYEGAHSPPRAAPAPVPAGKVRVYGEAGYWGSVSVAMLLRHAGDNLGRRAVSGKGGGVIPDIQWLQDDPFILIDPSVLKMV
eukprot:gene9998-biopygen7407